MARVKIVGAGSIGNHLAHAARSLGWAVTLCDVDAAALERTKNLIYPGRYGAWDDSIELLDAREARRSGYDLIAIGTPPDSHLPLAIEAIDSVPRALLVEKPLSPPHLERVEELRELAERRKVPVFVGHTHAVGRAAARAREHLAGIGAVETLDVEVREHWAGIFAAHPWLRGPEDSYLGSWQRGGGASGEHSHALHLWQDLARAAGAGRVVEVTATMDFVRTSVLDYDRLCLMSLRTEHGLLGRVVQDVVTSPARKWASVQGRDGRLELWIGLPEGADRLESQRHGRRCEVETFPKSRPNDFIQELLHIEQALASGPEASPISLQPGLDTMLVLAAAHRSARERRTVEIDYRAGYRPEALRLL